MNLTNRFLVKGGKSFKLAKRSCDDTAHIKDKGAAADELLKLVDRLDHLQQVLYAEHKRSLLILLQGMDAAGKDGVSGAGRGQAVVDHPCIRLKAGTPQVFLQFCSLLDRRCFGQRHE